MVENIYCFAPKPTIESILIAMEESHSFELCSAFVRRVAVQGLPCAHFNKFNCFFFYFRVIIQMWKTKPDNSLDLLPWCDEVKVSSFNDARHLCLVFQFSIWRRKGRKLSLTKVISSMIQYSHPSECKGNIRPPSLRFHVCPSQFFRLSFGHASRLFTPD